MIQSYNSTIPLNGGTVTITVTPPDSASGYYGTNSNAATQPYYAPTNYNSAYGGLQNATDIYGGGAMQSPYGQMHPNVWKFMRFLERNPHAREILDGFQRMQELMGSMSSGSSGLTNSPVYSSYQSPAYTQNSSLGGTSQPYGDYSGNRCHRRKPCRRMLTQVFNQLSEMLQTLGQFLNSTGSSGCGASTGCRIPGISLTLNGQDIGSNYGSESSVPDYLDQTEEV